MSDATREHSGTAAAAAATAAPDVRSLSPRELIDLLHQMRGAPVDAAYWQRLADALQRLTRARAAWLITRAQESPWQVLGRSTDAAHLGEDPLRADWHTELTELVARAHTQGFASLPGRQQGAQALWWAAVRLERLTGGWLLLAIPEQERAQMNELLLRARLVADLPAPAHLHDSRTAAAPNAPPLWDEPPWPAALRDAPSPAPAPLALAAPQATPGAGAGQPATAPDAAAQASAAHSNDMLARMSQAEGFAVAVRALVNGLAAETGAQQVALAWCATPGARPRLVAISHRDHFDRFSETVAQMTDAMDESLVHANGLLWLANTTTSTTPSSPPPATPCPAHDIQAQGLNGATLLSLPLAASGANACAVLQLVWAAGDANAPTGLPWRSDFLARLQWLLPWLATLQMRERSWPLRLAESVRRSLGGLTGPRQRLRRGAAMLASGVLLYAVFGSWTYRVHAQAQMATDATRIISAQLDARIETAHVSAGDNVREGQVLASFDTRELRQQHTDAGAELTRYTAEADRARAGGALAELAVASARAAQADARLAHVANQLAQAEHRAPFDGIVVEGERKDLQGAPARKGEKLYRLARIEGLYATLQVSERDAAQVQAGATGELALVARPDDKLPLRVLAVIPVAQTKGAEGNQFLVRAELQGPAQDWWRPGMSGSARINAGERPILWLLSHRLMDSARLFFWW